jgi:cold shock CspA family protein
MDPVIKSRFEQFRDKMDLKTLPEGVAFEQFVNYSLLIGHQPDAFSGDNELFDAVNIGGSNDMGIDGVAIKVNGLLIRSLEEIKDLIDIMQRIDVEFIFIQSKSSEHFEKGELLKFTSGIKEFLSETQIQPINEKIHQLIKIKDYLMDDCLSKLNDNPSIRLYYVVMGKWFNDPQLTSVADTFRNEIGSLNAYNEIIVNFVDSRQFSTILNSNENKFEVTINALQIMPMLKTDDVDNSCILLCTANELNKLLMTPDKLIRKSLFYDNVRDYQGDNSINNEIAKTITTKPQKFALFNNGITIVCEMFNISFTDIRVKNPQIVNGCQTSHVIFNNSKNNQELSSKIPVVVKLIATKNDEITNQIVRSTNRQNIVYEEAFETTKPFHKELEEYINVVSPKYEKFYYERRSKQYSNDVKIKNYEKINLRCITQSFVGMFLCEPHNSHRHETKLIEMYRNLIFQERQSKLPYFTASLAFYKLEKYFRQNMKDKGYYTYKQHILMIFSQIVAGNVPNINEENNIEVYCNKILDVLKDEQKTYNKFIEAIKIFGDARIEWVDKLKKDRFGIKDVAEFTELLLKNIRKTNTIIQVKNNNVNEDIYFGEIITIRQDRYGKYYGFINNKNNYNDVFFHQSQTRFLDLSDNNIIGCTVTYKLMKDHSDRIMAKDVKLIGKNGT